MQKPAFMNFQVDHMTLLVQPSIYNVGYVLFRSIFGVRPEDILYDKRKTWDENEGEKGMTYALRLGEADETPRELQNTIIAVVQPSEPKNQSSHVREMLDGHKAAIHWQHIALRTPDLLAFHKHAVERGVNFITPILRDDTEDLIQVFSGEWYMPGMPPSGVFFEFLQRKPSDDMLTKLDEQNNEGWFRDKTFLGLYGEKETEYQKNAVTPFVDFELFEMLKAHLGDCNTWDIDADMMNQCEKIMMDYAKNKPKK